MPQSTKPLPKVKVFVEVLVCHFGLVWLLMNYDVYYLSECFCMFIIYRITSCKMLSTPTIKVGMEVLKNYVPFMPLELVLKFFASSMVFKLAIP